MGYALGRPDLSSSTDTDPKERNKRTHEDFFKSEGGDIQEQGMDSHANSSIPFASGLQTFPIRPPTSTRRLQRSMLSMRRARRKSVGNFGFSLENMFSDQTEGQGAGTPETSHSNLEQGFPSRPFYPLKKRLSALSYSHESSLASSSRPGSPSVSFSNGSAAFSYAESATPIFGDAPAAPRVPNKLVKRVPPERTSDGPFLQIGTAKRSTIRRPATSHQRSADFVRRSGHTSALFSEDNHTRASNVESVRLKEPQWRQYFGVKVSHDPEALKKRGLVVDAVGIRRIVPDPKYTPTLVMARNIIPSSFEVDDSLSQDHGSSINDSRSDIPCVEPATIATSSISNRPDLNSETQAKRSFSFGDLLNTSQIARRASLSSKMQSNRLSRRRNSRIISAPVFSPNYDLKPSADTKIGFIKNKEPTYPMALEQHHYSVPTGAIATGEHGLADISYEAPTNSPTSPAEKVKSRVQDLGFQTTTLSSTIDILQSPRAEHMGKNSTLQTENHKTGEILPKSKPREFQLQQKKGDEQDRSGQGVSNISRTRDTKSSFVIQSHQLNSIFDPSLKEPANDAVWAAEPSTKKHRTNFISEFKKPDYPGIRPGPGLAKSTIKPEILSPSESSNESELFFGSTKEEQDIFTSVSKSPQPSDCVRSTPDADMDVDESSWSFGDDEEPGSWLLPTSDTSTAPSPQTKSNTPSNIGANSTPMSAHIGDAEYAEKDTRISIFDWSEQPSEKSTSFRTPPRPKTVHGKKDADGKANRVVGRRAPSGLHARSQSVPAVPDIAGKRDAVVRNKFGTWGVGTKGVTEDWNDDFDFPEFGDDMKDSSESLEPRVDSGFSMVVPKVIQEQQNNVLANIGLLREWGILIEELKTLRPYAASLGLLETPADTLWNEVDAMIDLADQEAEDETLWPRASSPPSPGRDVYAFDGPTSLPSRNTRPRRKSVLPSEDDIFSINYVDHNRQDNHNPAMDVNVRLTRPRKDSEAVARSVIEALQKRKSSSDPSSKLQPGQSSKKVPFDTATLRHIVPYVSGLLRKVKDVLRDAEKLYSSPRQGSNNEEPFTTRLYPDPIEESPTSRKSRRRDSNSPSTSEQQAQSNESELTPRFKMMKVM